MTTTNMQKPRGKFPVFKTQLC